jgi:shikimate kinase
MRSSPVLTEASQAIVLIGMPGAGKTTVGAALAQLLQWRFVDTDDLISRTVGCDFADYIRTHGIEAAREKERLVVSRLRGVGGGSRVLAVGGGTVLDPANRVELKALGPLVWLRADVATLVARLRADAHDRPLLAGDLDAAVTKLVAERTPVYADVATQTVDVDGLDPNEAAIEVMKALTS